MRQGRGDGASEQPERRAEAFDGRAIGRIDGREAREQVPRVDEDDVGVVGALKSEARAVLDEEGEQGEQRCRADGDDDTGKAGDRGRRGGPYGRGCAR
jgi:hypothetical protein